MELLFLLPSDSRIKSICWYIKEKTEIMMKDKLKVGIAQVLLVYDPTLTKTEFQRNSERRTSNLKIVQYKHYSFRHPTHLTKNLKQV